MEQALELRKKQLTKVLGKRYQGTDAIRIKLPPSKPKWKTRIDVYETLCPQQMLVHKGGKIKNWGGECRDGKPTKLQSQNIFKESTGGVRMDVNEECERRIELKFL